jgi:hypothetical protein
MPTKVGENARNVMEVVSPVCEPQKKLIIHSIFESSLKPIAFLKQSATEESGYCGDI